MVPYASMPDWVKDRLNCKPSYLIYIYPGSALPRLPTCTRHVRKQSTQWHRITQELTAEKNYREHSHHLSKEERRPGEMADNSSKKPADTPFKQQRLPAWQPILSPPWVICCFFVVVVVFIPIGALVIVASGKVVEYEIEYAAEASKTSRTMIAGQKCEEWISIHIDKDMEPRVYM